VRRRRHTAAATTLRAATAAATRGARRRRRSRCAYAERRPGAAPPSAWAWRPAAEWRGQRRFTPAAVNRRVGVAYGRGRSLRVCFDGKVAVELPELFDAVVPDGCAWTLESGVLALTLQKAEARPWATLALGLTKA